MLHKRSKCAVNPCYVMSLVCLAGCILCLWFAFGPKDDSDSVEKIENVKLEEKQETAGKNIPPVIREEQKSYESPINFELLKEKNSEIYAWLSIPGTVMDFPIVQSEHDDKFYLGHDSFGEVKKAGAIYTEKTYNNKDFEDPVTLIYGHKMRSDARFSTLQESYDTQEAFLKHKNIKVYLPDRELNYEVFAAVPYGNLHILYRYDFDKIEDYDSFLREVFSLPGVFDSEMKVGSEDKLVVLSTCLAGDFSRRYIVLAKRV